MAKRISAYDLVLPPRGKKEPGYRWLSLAIRQLILGGQLRPGTRLPGSRELAEQYGLSRGTIVSAFEELKAEGYLEGTVGSGTYVSATLPERFLQVPSVGKVRAEKQVERKPSRYGLDVRPFPVLEDRVTRAFRANLPALDLFPSKIWAQISARSLRESPTQLLLGCPALGYLPLREAVADYLVSSRGVRCAADQVVIVSGVQEAIDIVGRVFVNPGDKVCVEDPGYPGASIVFKALGAQIADLPLDVNGASLIPKLVEGAKIVYVTPAHQFPVGVAMSIQRRAELLEWARNTGGVIFEDDYDSEFRYSGRPLPAMQGLDRNGSVLFAGSFSKVMFPSLRLGYLVVPSDLVEVFEAVKSVTSRHPPMLDQVVLADFIADGHFGRHLRRMRGIYSERLNVLLEGAKAELAGLLEIPNIEAGLQTVGWLSTGIDEEEATQAVAARKVEVIRIGRYTRSCRVPPGLQLGFAAVGVGEIKRGVRELGAALRGVLAKR